MQYLLLIYRNEAEAAKMTEAQAKDMTAEFSVFTQSIVQSGHFKGGDRLHPTNTATTVRVRDGKTSQPMDRSPRPMSNSLGTTW